MNILTVNLVLSTAIFWWAARIYVLPKLNRIGTNTILIPILLLHTSRHFGLMFLAPGAIYPGLAEQFSVPAALGDLASAILAAIALALVLANSRWSRLATAVFNIVGTVDLISAITLATIYEAAPHMGAAYWIPAFWVPTLLVTHYITFVLLKREWVGSGKTASNPRNSATKVA